jgi:predicted metal-dependent phosphoesterase TrpH
MHTRCSDGKLTPEEIAEQALQIGLKGFAITDHHTLDGYYQARTWLDQAHLSDTTNPVPQLWVGLEVNAGLLNDEVHILCYAFQPDHGAMQPYLAKRTTHGEDYDAQAVIQAVHTSGGIAVLAHPARYRRSPEKLITAAAALGIDGVETYYAYNNPTQWIPSPQQTQEVYALTQQHGLLNTCGTDTHGRSILQRI